MIFFVTSYDEATRPNLAVAKHLSGSTHQLFEDCATRDMLWHVLNKSQDIPLLAMSHGRRRYLRAQHGKTPHAIRNGDESALGKRRVFAWACLTSAELGIAAASAGSIWFGFPVKIAAPPENPYMQMMLASILQVAISGLDKVHDERSCRALLDQIVDRADSALMELEQMRERDQLLDAEFDSAVQQCFEQFQLRLEAWLPGNEVPVRPTRAPSQRYDDLDPVRDLSASSRAARDKNKAA
jgi:hypothetical protein